MMDWLNRGAREKRRRNRKWRILGLLLVGIAIAVYWFDRQTSNAFEHASHLHVSQTPRSPDSQQPPLDDESAARADQRAAEYSAMATDSIRTDGSAPSAGSSLAYAEDIPEPNTAAEDETIVQGETGQLAASQSPGAPAGRKDAALDGASSAGGAKSAPTSSEHLAETGPVPTITGGLIEGNGTHDCPDGFPIKGNASSRIYHLPGESTYEVTIPEICFATEEDAASAGYRPRKR